jgi:hypothetical protein
MIFPTERQVFSLYQAFDKVTKINSIAENHGTQEDAMDNRTLAV